MMRAFANDVAQRVITCNKKEQKAQLQKTLSELEVESGMSVLDFGCGTGLFLPAYKSLQLDYVGYDVDAESIRYADNLYRDANFTSDWQAVKGRAPFHVAVANCCFHHIADGPLADVLKNIAAVLTHPAWFVVVDILRMDHSPGFLHAMLMKAERGAHVRAMEDYVRLIEKSFGIVRCATQRSHAFSITNKVLYNDMAVLCCRPRGHSDHDAEIERMA